MQCISAKISVTLLSVTIRGFASKAETPKGSEILGRVVFVQVPWLPCMKKKKSGFMEDEQLY